MPFSDIIGHERPKALLRRALAHDRLAHAYLFHGEESIGKRLTAVRLSQAILCEGMVQPSDADPCGTCRACRQVESRTHPDFLVIEPDREAANPQIKIDQIREIEQQMIYRPLIGSLKVTVIDEADRMTIGAANALLKTLEEPPAHSLFVLVTSKPLALPATVRSRCQLLRFAAPARTQIEAALILRRNIPPAEARFLALLYGGKLGKALSTDLKQAHDEQQEFATLVAPHTLKSVTALLGTAETFAKSDRGPEALAWLSRWLRDVIVVGAGGDPDSTLTSESGGSQRHPPADLDLDGLLELFDQIETLQRQATRNLNLQLALETILLRLRDLIGAPVVPARSR